MKERIYKFNCGKCKNASIVKLSDFLQHIKDDRENISISFNRRCLKCNSVLSFSMKASLFVSVIENINIGKETFKENKEAPKNGK